jgi:hypothetical protein
LGGSAGSRRILMHMTGLLLKNDRFRSGLHSLSDVKQDASLENPRVGGSIPPLGTIFTT